MSRLTMDSTLLANGTARVTVILKATGQNQTITLNKGYKLYLAKTTFDGDSYGSDYSLGDDVFVIVNQMGYPA